MLTLQKSKINYTKTNQELVQEYTFNDTTLQLTIVSETKAYVDKLQDGEWVFVTDIDPRILAPFVSI